MKKTSGLQYSSKPAPAMAALQWLLVLVVVIFWAAVFGLLLHIALALKDTFPALAGLAGLALVGLACWLARLSLR